MIIEVSDLFWVRKPTFTISHRTQQQTILGVQFDKDNYFTIHASASGGGDAAGIVNIIANYFGSRQEYDHQFMIMGDYNRTPQDLRASLSR